MSTIQTYPNTVAIKAMRGVELMFSAAFFEDKAGNVSADISGYGVTAELWNRLASDDPRSKINTFTITVNDNGSYFMRNDTEGVIDIIIGADESKTLKTDGSKYYLQIYLTTGGKPVQSVMAEIQFAAGAIA